MRHLRQRHWLGYCADRCARIAGESSTPAHWHLAGFSCWQVNAAPQRGQDLCSIVPILFTSFLWGEKSLFRCKSNAFGWYMQVLMRKSVLFASFCEVNRGGVGCKGGWYLPKWQGNGRRKRREIWLFIKKICFVLAYVRKKQYLCREKCSFANIASEIIQKNCLKT